MQDMKIEYRDGKLIELSIDNVSFMNAKAISFSHVAGETLPSITLTLPIGSGDRLKPDRTPANTSTFLKNDINSHLIIKRKGGGVKL